MPLFKSFDEKSTISDFVTRIYDAALDPKKWQIFVDLLSERLDGIEPLLYLADAKSATMEKLIFSEAWGSDFLTDYMTYYNSINPWTASLARTSKVCVPLTGEDIVSDAELKNSEFYVDFFKARWDWWRVIGTVLHRDRNAFCVFGLHATERIYDNYKSELHCLTERLAPHLQQAFQISRQLEHGAAYQTQFEAMLERITTAAIVVDADMRVCHANRAAETLFAKAILRLDTGRKLLAGSKAQDTNALHLALKDILALDLGARHRCLDLSVSKGDGAACRSMIIQIMPLAGASAGTTNLAPSLFECKDRAGALILISDPSSDFFVNIDVLRACFDLTPAESKLAAAIAAGESLEAYAQARGVCKGTVRAQLKSVFAKTNTHRQSELTALIHKLSAMPLNTK